MRFTLTETVFLITGARPTLLAANLPAHLRPFPWEEMIVLSLSLDDLEGEERTSAPEDSGGCMPSPAQIQAWGTTQNTSHFWFCLFQQGKENIYINNQE